MLSDKAKEEIKKIASRYATKRSAVMAAMRIAQGERGGLMEDDMREIASMLGIRPIEVHEIGGFYTMYNVERHIGRHHIQVCQNISCSLLGAEHLIEHLETRLGIKSGETTADKKFTLSRVECLGSCGTAPVMQINDDYYEGLTKERLEDILKGRR
ncbi:MAG: NADH-quinone oxidoreductase subunit NuoE [Deltaproteobacteria bacterium]|nr:NADH-quinone oxidoreductase subunit NuoE [Deltaproteobacteria bacterium]